jgi:hypothetical protein
MSEPVFEVVTLHVMRTDNDSVKVIQCFDQILKTFGPFTKNEMNSLIGWLLPAIGYEEEKTHAG